MKTIKVIDLFNKIANGEEPPKQIKYKGDLYELTKWQNIEETDYQCVSRGRLLGDIYLTILNDEVEIIEEDKPKENNKIDRVSLADVKTDYRLKDILNEIIDKINGDDKDED